MLLSLATDIKRLRKEGISLIPQLNTRPAIPRTITPSESCCWMDQAVYESRGIKQPTYHSPAADNLFLHEPTIHVCLRFCYCWQQTPHLNISSMEILFFQVILNRSAFSFNGCSSTDPREKNMLVPIYRPSS